MLAVLLLTILALRSSQELDVGEENPKLAIQYISKIITENLKWSSITILRDEGGNKGTNELIESLNQKFIKLSTSLYDIGDLESNLEIHRYKYGKLNIFAVTEDPDQFNPFMKHWINESRTLLKESWFIFASNGSLELCKTNLPTADMRYVFFNRTHNHYELHHCMFGQNSVEVLKDLKNGNPKTSEKRGLDLKGKKMLVGSLGFNFPFMIGGYRKGKYYYPEDGLDFRIMNGFAKAMNFTYDILHVKNGKWGSLTDNGTWNGMIGMLERREVDIAVSGLSRTTARLKVADFSNTYLFNQLTFATIAPQERSKVQAPIVPFQKEVWLAYMGCLIITALFLTFMASFDLNFLKKSQENSTNEDNFSILSTFGRNIWYMYGAALMQAGHTPYHTGVKILVSAWWLLVITLLASYGAMLTSFLTYPGKEEAIDTMSKLGKAVREGRIKCGAQKGTSHYNLFTTAKSGLFKEIGDNILSDPNNAVPTIKAGLAKIIKEKNYVYIGGYLRVRANMDDENLFKFSKEPFTFYTYNVALQKGFPYVNQIDSLLKKMNEAGLIDKWMEELMTKHKKPSDLLTSTERPIQLKDLQGAFLIIGVGYLISVLTLILEKFLNIYRGRKSG